MRDDLAHVLERLRRSMWFIPSLMSAGAIIIATAAELFPARVELHGALRNLLFSGGTLGARAILTMIAGSMIGVTGVVFSITIVALTLASSQFGPRLLRNFMRDRVVQSVLGMFIATFMFCLLALRSVPDVGNGEGVYLVVVVAVLLAIASIGFLIYFIHHIAGSLRADTVVARVAEEIAARLAMSKKVDTRGDAPDAEARGRAEGGRQVRVPSTGYVQRIQVDDLIAHARSTDLYIELVVKPGAFVIQGEVGLRAWPAERVDDHVAASLAKTIAVGRERTAEADIDFLLDQLAEIACRALSPGINDPFTAVQCIDRLGAALVAIHKQGTPTLARRDAEGGLRVSCENIPFGHFVDLSFDQIRNYGSGAPTVVCSLLDTLSRVGAATRDEPEHHAAVLVQADRVLRSALLHDLEDDDQARILRHHASVRAAVA